MLATKISDTSPKVSDLFAVISLSPKLAFFSKLPVRNAFPRVSAAIENPLSSPSPPALTAQSIEPPGKYLATNISKSAYST